MNRLREFFAFFLLRVKRGFCAGILLERQREPGWRAKTGGAQAGCRAPTGRRERESDGASGVRPRRSFQSSGLASRPGGALRRSDRRAGPARQREVAAMPFSMAQRQPGIAATSSDHAERRPHAQRSIVLIVAAVAVGDSSLSVKDRHALPMLTTTFRSRPGATPIPGFDRRTITPVPGDNPTRCNSVFGDNPRRYTGEHFRDFRF